MEKASLLRELFFFCLKLLTEMYIMLKVESLCIGLQDSWQDLKMKAYERGKKLGLSLKAQQFFFEANEVESWLNERNDVLSSTDYGRDRDAASKLLTKHKVIS